MGFTIGVVGASGGVGASTLTAALAVRAQVVVDDCQAVVAVDLDPRGGLDATLCMEHLPGTRWQDLERRDWLTGHGDPPLDLAQLPGEDGVAVLTGRGWSGRDLGPSLETLDELAHQVSVMAVDCGPRPAAALLSRLDLLVVLSRLSPAGLHHALLLDPTETLAGTRAVLVSRGGKGERSGPAAARQLGLPFLTHLPDDPRLARHGLKGLAPGMVRSAVDGVADEVLALADSSWLHSLIDPSATGLELRGAR